MKVSINGKAAEVAPGTTVAAALVNHGVTAFRRSVGGETRAPLCGMGICFECRVTVNGTSQQRSCQTVCEPGMEILSDE